MRKKQYFVTINGKTFEAKHGERVLHMPHLTGPTILGKSMTLSQVPRKPHGMSGTTSSETQAIIIAVSRFHHIIT